jgi:hypothetical protein
MAENFRTEDPDSRPLIARRQEEIYKECKRQEESCLYTSTQLFIWLRKIRWQKKFFVVAPIVIGGAAGLAVLQEALPTSIIALMSFAAGTLKSLAEPLGIETQIDEVSRLAATYKPLQDRFRRSASIAALGDVDQAEAALNELMERMEIARSSSITPPEQFFQKAREKIKAGHYDFRVDGPTFADGGTPPAKKS